MSILEPTTTNTSNDPEALTATRLAQLVLAAQARGEEVVSVLSLSGDDAAHRVLFQSDLSRTGSFRNDSLNDAAAALAAEVFAARTPLLRDDLFAELHTVTQSLIIFGAGHIAVPLAELGTMLGFTVTVLDDRREFADADRFPNATVQTLDYTEPLRGLQFDRNTFVVLVTRAHEYDFECLRELLMQEVQPAYIGMIGSRRRVRAAFTALLQGGIPRQKLERVSAPVGLDIAAETPAEIAVSIMAEIISVKRGGKATRIGQQEQVLNRFFESNDD